MSDCIGGRRFSILASKVWFSNLERKQSKQIFWVQNLGRHSGSTYTGEREGMDVRKWGVESLGDRENHSYLQSRRRLTACESRLQ